MPDPMSEPTQTSRPRAPEEGCACDRPSAPHEVADRLGIGVSLTCAVHCAATGALSLAPSLMGAASHGETLELVELPLLLMALVVGLYSLVPAYRTEHGRPQPLALFLAGLGLLFVSRLVEGPAELVSTVTGVGLVACAHLVNLRLCARAHAAPGLACRAH